jgi:predicted nucleic acid-binding protein
MNYLLDTNILLRAAEPGHIQHPEARDATAKLAKRGEALCLVPQNFYEYWVVSTRPLAQNGRGKTPDEVLTEVAFLESHFAIFADTPAVFTEWTRLMRKYKVTGKPSHDARFVAAMLAHGLTHLLTFNDQDFRRYSEITAVHPGSIISVP